MSLEHPVTAGLLFSQSWDVLGPFQMGTREATWGADPLDEFGGFRSLEYDANAKIPSSLGTGGNVCWLRCLAHRTQTGNETTEAALDVAFPAINWGFHQSVYGWAGLQYQAWARGTLTVTGQGPQTILFFTDNVLEFWLNDKHYFGGDYYGFRRAPVVVYLQSGLHRLNVRLIRDVRVMGSGAPTVSITLKAARSNDDLKVMHEKALLPDVVEGRLAGSWASVPVRNDSQEWIEIRSLEGINCKCSLSATCRLAPGQSRPLSIHLKLIDSSILSISLSLTYAVDTKSDQTSEVHVSFELTPTSRYAPHKITFLHPSQIVSYAILRAPSQKAASSITSSQPLPILVNLHGAGVDADSSQVRHMLDQVPDLLAWVLFPTGVTSWCGDDWHDWGFADVESAAASIPEWIANVGWEGPRVAMNQWLVCGHSNGGQGALYILTHHPEKVIGAALVSGYTSIQAYIPYQMWTEADPRITSICQSALLSFRHELLLQNFKDIPLLQQHCNEDNNVPAFHSRRLFELTQEQSSSRRYVEIESQDHWFEGAMTTPPLISFYDACLKSRIAATEMPQSFTIIIANPRDMGALGGLKVDQLRTPGQLGKIEVTAAPALASVTLKTSNIRRFHIVWECPLMMMSKIIVDGKSMGLPEIQAHSYLSENGAWTLSYNTQWMHEERWGSQIGPMSAIFNSSGCFHIQYRHTDVFDIALQVSRSLYQYYGADTELCNEAPSSISENTITIALGARFPSVSEPSFPVQLVPEGVRLRTHNGEQKIYSNENSLGVIFLRPLLNGRLDLVIWGLEYSGVRQAARLLPLLTGVGQPDFVVVNDTVAWRGAAGVLAMGFFDSHWQIAESHYMQ